MGNLGEVLRKKVESLGISRQVEAVDVVERATKEIEKFISREDFEVISFNKGVLKVGTKDSIVSNEIKINSNKISVAELNIKKIIFSQQNR